MREGLSSHEYLTSLATSMWGGTPEMDLLAMEWNVGFVVKDLYGRTLYENLTNGVTVHLLMVSQHFFLKKVTGSCRTSRGSTSSTSCSSRAGMPLRLISNDGGLRIEVPSPVDDSEPEKDAPPVPRSRSPPRQKTKVKKEKTVKDDKPTIDEPQQTVKTSEEFDEDYDWVLPEVPGHMEPSANDPPEKAPGDEPSVVRSWGETADLNTVPWIYKFKNGEAACLLCMKWSDKYHLESKAHVKKSSQHIKCTIDERDEWVGAIRCHLNAHDDAGDKKWTTDKDDGSKYCKLCEAEATSAHLYSLAHRAAVGLSNWNIAFNQPIIQKIRRAEEQMWKDMGARPKAAPKQSAAASSSSTRAGLPLALADQVEDQGDWLNVSIYRVVFPHWRQVRYGQAGYWSYQMPSSSVGLDVKKKVCPRPQGQVLSDPVVRRALRYHPR